MQGAHVSVTIDDARARRAIEAMIKASADPAPAMELVGASLLASTQQRFEDDESPMGQHWKSLALSTQLQQVSKGGRDTKGRYAGSKRGSKRGGSHILVVKGLLLASLTYLSSKIGVDVGSGRTQAAIHQFGGSADMAPGPAAIPARPYLGLSAADEAEIGDIVLAHMEKAIP